MPQAVPHAQVALTGGFLRDKQQLIKDVTIPAIYKSYEQTGRGRDEALEELVDGFAEAMKNGQTAEGYFNVCYLTKKPAERFTERGDHELYCGV